MLERRDFEPHFWGKKHPILTEQLLLSVPVPEGDPLGHRPEDDPEGKDVSLGRVVPFPDFWSHVEVGPAGGGEAVLVDVPLPLAHLAEAEICHLRRGR